MSVHTAEKSDRPERWHYLLHPAVQKHHPRNPMPGFLRDLIHPTHVTLTTEESDEKLAWTSRDHRKNRHLDVSPNRRHTRYGKGGLSKIGHMRRIEYWNVSWWVAMAFTVGSIAWVINGFAVFLPNCNSHFEKAPNSSGWTAFIGATIFELGSIFGMWEAWNREDVANFGWGVRNSIRPRQSNIEEDLRRTPTVNRSLVEEKPEKGHWVWFSLDRRYWHELGFLAAFSQLCAASIFWISGFTAIPTIQSSIESRTGLLDGVFWVPQVVGGSGFVISSTFIMLEVQKKWFLPNPVALGWHVGLWNFIGAVGFTLSGAFGFAAASHTWADYQSSLSTFWGGWAFLIGSIVQWYESVNSV